jgi:small subunit ribosomal protein S20
MPTTESAKKRLRQNEKREAANQSVKSRIKTLKKKAVAAAEAGGEDSAGSVMKECFSALDKAAKKGVHNKRKVAREKSRLCAAVRRSR